MEALFLITNEKQNMTPSSSKIAKFGEKGDFVGVPNFARPKDDVAGIKIQQDYGRVW
jgi:hypothetical protein